MEKSPFDFRFRLFVNYPNGMKLTAWSDNEEELLEQSDKIFNEQGLSSFIMDSRLM